MRHAETARLIKEAFAASGCKTHADFIALWGGAIGMRTFRGWLKGEPATPLAQLCLREFINGWRPVCHK